MNQVVDTAAKARLFTVRRLVVALAIAGAVVALFFALALYEESPELPLRPAAIRFISPEPGTLGVRQGTVFYELGDQYTGTLRLDSVTIPMDQLDVISGLNRISFTPGAGKDVETLEPGAHTATAVFWPLGKGRAEARSYTWRFNVH